MIKVQCPHCNETLEVPDCLVGQEDTCPTCGKTIPIPAQAPVNLSELQDSISDHSQRVPTPPDRPPVLLQPPSWPEDMNKTQGIIALVGVIVVLCMILVPPWLEVPTSMYSSSFPTRLYGYGLIFEKPVPIGGHVYECRINWTRLIVQVGIAAVLFGGLLFIFRDRNRNA